MNNYNLNLSSYLEKVMDGKKVLLIPMVSMREYGSNIYNLACDGNLNAVIKKIRSMKSGEVTLTIPKKNKNKEFLYEKFKESKVKVELVETNNYGVNALETRKNKKWLNFVKQMLSKKKYDLIVFTPNIIGTLDFKDVDVIYWAIVSDTIKTKLSFLNGFGQLDKTFHNKYKMVVSTLNQKKFFPKSIIDNNIFDFSSIKLKPSKNKFKNIIFVPFRQSDKYYKVEDIYRILEKTKKYKNYTILYTAPNNFVVDTTIPNIRVSNDRESFYSILKYSPEIFYMCDPDDVIHTSIFEFIYFNCKIHYLKNSMFWHKEHKNEYKDFEDFERKMKNE
jgi:hypothetical protein